MKSISILQPWASLCVTADPKTGKAYKYIETRSWNTKYRGPLLIHASIGKQYRKLPTDGPLWMNCPQRIIESMPFGAIIGMVNLVDTMNTERIILPPNETKYRSIISDPWKISDQELAFGDYSHGRYGWLLSDPVLFQTPIPCKGNLSIWNLPVELEGKVWQEIYAAKGQTGMVAIIYHTKEYQRKSVHYTAELGTDRAEDLIRQTTELINKMGDDSRYSIQYFSKEEYENITELVAGKASSEKVHVSGSCHITESAYRPTLIASPGEGAVVVEGVKTTPKTIGQLLTESFAQNELKAEVVERKLNFPAGIITRLMNDDYYTNSVPVILFKNLILSLHIKLSDVYNAMIPTFNSVLAKETPETIKKKPAGYHLWENKESVKKYTAHLKELIEFPESKLHLPSRGIDGHDENQSMWDEFLMK